MFGKSGGPKTLTTAETLEEALCFGWINGQMSKIDEQSYKKYFAPRRARSRWSEKNKAIVADVEERKYLDFQHQKISRNHGDALAQCNGAGANKKVLVFALSS